jgi:amidase
VANFFLQVEDYEAIVKLLQENGCTLKYPAQIASVDELVVDGEGPIMPIACKYC